VVVLVVEEVLLLMEEQETLQILLQVKVITVVLVSMCQMVDGVEEEALAQ
jgi:hypothetical protein